MKKLISAMLALLMLASAAMANPGPPPRRGGPGPGRGPAMRPGEMGEWSGCLWDRYNR